MVDNSTSQTPDKIKEALISAINDAFKTGNRTSVQAAGNTPAAPAEVHTEKPHTHKLSENENGLFCTDCDTPFVKADKAENLIHNLTTVFHKKSHDPLGCSTCRTGMLDEISKFGKGYNVNEDGNRITIEPKDE